MATTSDPGAVERQSAFWQFSLDFYARPQVAAACLQLQDNAGIDVNLLLYLLFIATKNRQIERDDLVRMDTLVKTWREEAVLPLRTLRRRLKTGIKPLPATNTEALRSAIKRSELDAEHIEQDLLERLAPASALGVAAASRSVAAHANLAVYREFVDGWPDAPVKILLEAHAQLPS